MTLLQLNIALASITVVLVSLLGACLLYSFRTVKSKIKQNKEQ
ncbi:hypothetical protein ACFO26_03780 [Lactococcus nasutitermitis]|uniref:DUF3149 domain-containing protein n=1 Tax=Lactococcus nasutitermitis TaxID=1652957 RepID=A0ABV9JB43_9LACT|nr:hypothetical protein [Lactococcus nasutitermitis]